MVTHPPSPPLYTTDYSQTCKPDLYCIPSHNRKRQRDDSDVTVDIDVQMSKKSRDEAHHPVPLSPPQSVKSQLMSPKSDTNTRPAVSIPGRNACTSAPLSYMSPSDQEFAIPVQNLLLRNLHMNSRVYQNNQKHIGEENGEEMWEEEEEVVTERYAEMNKILGERKSHWQ